MRDALQNPTVGGAVGCCGAQLEKGAASAADALNLTPLSLRRVVAVRATVILYVCARNGACRVVIEYSSGVFTCVAIFLGDPGASCDFAALRYVREIAGTVRMLSWPVAGDAGSGGGGGRC